MAFTIYKNTDGSAPVLSGTVDSYCALLSACLVNGYGAKSAAGWTAPFDGTNKTVFRNGTGSTQRYWRILDDGTVPTSAAREATIYGYESMTDVDTGMNPFPALVTTSIVRKSTTADATARDWIVAADARTAYIFVKSESAVGVAGEFLTVAIGDFFSFQANDNFRCFLIARNVSNSGAGASDTFARFEGNFVGPTAGNWMPRGHNLTYGPRNFGKHGDQDKEGATGIASGIIPYTNPSDGGLYLAPVWIQDPTTAPAPSVRGRLRGIWQFLHPSASVNDGDTVAGGVSGELSGKTFLFVKLCPSSAGTGVIGIETSNTLETN